MVFFCWVHVWIFSIPSSISSDFVKQLLHRSQQVSRVSQCAAHGTANFIAALRKWDMRQTIADLSVVQSSQAATLLENHFCKMCSSQSHCICTYQPRPQTALFNWCLMAMAYIIKTWRIQNTNLCGFKNTPLVLVENTSMYFAQYKHAFSEHVTTLCILTNRKGPLQKHDHEFPSLNSFCYQDTHVYFPII